MTSSALSSLELYLTAKTTSCITHSVIYLVILADPLLTNHVYTTMEILHKGCVCCRHNGCSLDNHSHQGAHFDPQWQQHCIHYLLIAGRPPFFIPQHHHLCQQIHHLEYYSFSTSNRCKCYPFLALWFSICGMKDTKSRS